jgi:hypothetical protein
LHQSFKTIEDTQYQYLAHGRKGDDTSSYPRNNIDGIRAFFCFKISPGEFEMQGLLVSGEW